jgi:IS30 family transposase
MEPYVHLSPDERMRIYQWRQEGLPQAEMARRLGRDRATISRELRRNAVPAGYLPDLAQRRYQARRAVCHRHPRLENRRLRRNVLLLLQQGLSPEQISGRLRVERGAPVVNHETIYRFVYESALGRQEKLYQYLRRGKKKRTRRAGRRAHTRAIAQRLFIEARPAGATARTEIGHWESDSLLFGHDQALNVLVDRLSRFTVVTRLRSKTAQDTCQVLIARLSQLPHASVTADNGSENADHRIVSQALSIPFYFCHPYHSWEKGTVENTNGLLRRYVPRDTNLDRLEQTDLDAMAAELNLRPRKCLGFLTPHEVLFGVSVALGN